MKVVNRWTPCGCECHVTFSRIVDDKTFEEDLSIPREIQSIDRCPIHQTVPYEELYDHLLYSEERVLHLTGLHIQTIYGQATYLEFISGGFEFTGTGKDRVLKVKTENITKKFSLPEKAALQAFIATNKALYGIVYDKNVDI